MVKRITEQYVARLEVEYKKKPTLQLEKKIRIAKAKLNHQK